MLTLAWLIGAGFLGPVITALSKNLVPVALGELIIGVVLGQSGANVVPIHWQSLQLISSIGFALMMMTVGSHINLPNLANRKVLPKAISFLALVVLASLPATLVIAKVTHFHHIMLLMLLTASSSAAVILPSLNLPKNLSPMLSAYIAQVSLSDFLALLLLPIALASGGASRRLIGSGLVAAMALALYLFLHWLDRSGRHAKIANTSKLEHLGLELRFSMLILLVITGIAIKYNVSPMVAGFAIGLVLGAVGLPRRLGKQLFAVSEGFFTPIFFVVLGAELDIKAALTQSRLMEMAVLIFFANLIAHMATRLVNQPLALGITASAQLGVPVAAVTMGQASGAITAGQGGAIMLAALLSILATIIAARKVNAANSY